jgi:hypothetical protein
VLDVRADEDFEKYERERRQFATFSALQNHYLLGCDLPMTDGVMEVLANRHQGENGDGEDRTNFDESIQRMHQYLGV